MSADIQPGTAKPTLHEIAAMPFPQSEQAMRKHYNPDWHKPIPEGVEAKRTFKVKVRYSYRVADTETVEVDAWTDEEAKDDAADMVAEKLDLPWNADFEADDCEIIREQAA